MFDFGVNIIVLRYLKFKSSNGKIVCLQVGGF